MTVDRVRVLEGRLRWQWNNRSRPFYIGAGVMAKLLSWISLDSLDDSALDSRINLARHSSLHGACRRHFVHELREAREK